MLNNTGLILEGGGMRGLYTCGVLDFFLEKNITFPSIYGVSAGACHACSYLSKQHGRAKRTVIDYIDDKRYASMYSFITSGDIFGEDLVYNLIPNELLPFDYKAFKENPSNLYAVLTNCITGEAEYKQVVDLRKDISIIRASSSLPLVSKIVKVDGSKYLDGGISDSIPLARSISDGNNINVVVLTQHRGFRKEPNSMFPIIKARYRKYTNLINSIKRRHIMYNETLDLIYQQENEGKALVIQPKEPVEIGRLEKNKEKLTALYNLGHQDAKLMYNKLLSFIEVNV